MRADALKLMDVFRQGQFHIAHAGLFLHHLDDVQAMTVLRIMDRLTSTDHGMVIWNDLLRGWFGRIGVRMTTMWPGVPHMVKHDGIASVNAGFTKKEAIDLAKRAGLARIQFRRSLFYRFMLTSEQQ
jgi:hypothetical protein